MKRILLIICIGLLASCSNDDDSLGNKDIYGYWVETEAIAKEEIDTTSNSEFSLKQVLSLEEDHNFNWLVAIINKDTEATLGYLSRETGTFSVNGNKLTLNFDRYEAEQASLSSGYHPVALDSLVLTDQNVQSEIPFVISNNNNTLYFDFPECEDTCPGDIEFQRLNFLF